MKNIVSRVRKFLPKNLQKKLPRELKVVPVPAAMAKKLNFQFRRKNHPTNVLSFRYDNNYGEILVCPAVIRQESKAARHTYIFQMTWMILHGMLHLAEMHHEKSELTAAKVKKLEEKILARIFK